MKPKEKRLMIATIGAVTTGILTGLAALITAIKA